MVTTAAVHNSKAFPSHRDRNEYVKHPDIEHEAVTLAVINGDKTIQDPLDQVPDLLEGLMHRAKSGYHDPMSVILVLDAMIQSAPGTYLRALQMSLWLNRNRPNFSWTPVAVGRIMGELVELAKDSFPTAAFYPVDAGADWRGNYVVIDPRGSIGAHAGRIWLMHLRNRLVPVVQAVVEVEALGGEARRDDSVWVNVDTSAKYA